MSLDLRADKTLQESAPGTEHRAPPGPSHLLVGPGSQAAVTQSRGCRKNIDGWVRQSPGAIALLPRCSANNCMQLSRVGAGLLSDINLLVDCNRALISRVPAPAPAPAWPGLESDAD